MSIFPPLPASGTNVLEFMYGLFGTAISWLFRFVYWDVYDKLPTFRCKSMLDNVSQKESSK